MGISWDFLRRSWEYQEGVSMAMVPQARGFSSGETSTKIWMKNRVGL